MIRCESDFFVGEKDALPLPFRIIKKGLDVDPELGGRVGVPEAQVFVVSTITGQLVIELREDEFEHLLEDINAGVGQDLVFHVLDQLTQGAGAQSLLFTVLFFIDEGLDSPRLSDDVIDHLGACRYVGNLDEIVWIFSMPDDGLRSVAPEGERGAGRMGIGFELFFSAFGRGLLHFHNQIGHRGPIGIEHHYVGPFGRVSAEGDGVLDRQTGEGIAIVQHQTLNPQLADDFLRLDLDLFSPNRAFEVMLAVLLQQACFDGRNRFDIK